MFLTTLFSKKCLTTLFFKKCLKSVCLITLQKIQKVVEVARALVGDFLAVFKQDDGGKALDLVFGGHVGLLVAIHLGNVNVLGRVFFQLVPITHH